MSDEAFTLYFKKPDGYDDAFNDLDVNDIIMNFSDEYNTFQAHLQNADYYDNYIHERYGEITYPYTFGVDNSIRVRADDNGFYPNSHGYEGMSDETLEDMYAEGLLEAVNIEGRDASFNDNGYIVHECQIRIILKEGQTLHHGLIPALYGCCPILIEYNSPNPNYDPSDANTSPYTTAYGANSWEEIRVYGLTHTYYQDNRICNYLTTNYPTCYDVLFGGSLNSNMLCNGDVYFSIFDDIEMPTNGGILDFDVYAHNVRVSESVVTYNESVNLFVSYQN